MTGSGMTGSGTTGSGTTVGSQPPRVDEDYPAAW
jgi:hypothetical protein